MNAMQMFYNLMPADEFYYCGSIKSTEKKYFQAKELVNLDCTNEINFFFTPNSLGYRYDKEKKKSFINRDRNHLSKLCCLYCDIDLKDAEDDYITIDNCYEYINAHILGSEIAEPTMINCSGNGLHLYWVIEPISYKGNIEKWMAMQNYIHSLFKRFGADAKVSCDTVRLLRVPDTVNQKDCGTTKAKNLSFTGKKYDLFELMNEYEVVEQPKIVSFADRKDNVKTNRKPIKNYNKDYSVPTFIHANIYNARIKDLETLLLKHRDGKGTGRETILFYYRFCQCNVLQDTQKALEMTLELNSRLTYPLTEKEVIGATKSAETYYKKGQFKLKNKQIVKLLSITDEEMKDMRCIMSFTEKKERKSKRNKTYYQNTLAESGKMAKKDAILMRQQQMYALLKQGLSRYEICKILNISRRTYYTDLSVINSPEWLFECKNIEVEEPQIDVVEKTGTDDSTGFVEMPKNQGFLHSAENSASVVNVCVYPCVGVPINGVKARGKP